MKVLIIEDETAAARNLQSMLEQLEAGVEIVGVTESIVDTVEWFSENENPDLVFMDIHIADGESFRIFDSVNISAPIIFTTAYDQYAIDAFKVNSVDYLLKPVKPEALADALAKFRRFSLSDLKLYLERLMELRPEARYPERMLLRLRDKLIPIAVENVAFVYTADRSTQVYMNDGMCYMSEKSMEQIASQLDPKQFMRVNKQFLLSRHSVKEITIWFDNRLRVNLTVATPEDIYISKNKSSEFKAWLIS